MKTYRKLKLNYTSLMLISLMNFITGSVYGQKVGKEVIEVVRPTADFALRADTAATIWQQTNWISLPQRGHAIEQRRTKAKLLYSEKGIYGIFYCEDYTITSALRADFSDLYNEDVVEIFFWTDEQYPIYFEYELSPHNYELPILVPNFSGRFFGWRPWHYEGDRLTRHAAKILTRDDKVTGWVGEFFIPYTLLLPLPNVPPKGGTTWRANLYRIDYDGKGSEWSWQPTTTNFHDYTRFGTIRFE